MSRIKRCFGRVIYAFASHMPPSYSVLNIGQKKLRGFCGKLILKSCGKNVNIEKNAQFDSSLSLGDNSGLGINCRIGAGVIIGDNVMMGPNVTVYTQNHETKRTDIPMCRQGVKKIGGGNNRQRLLDLRRSNYFTGCKNRQRSNFGCGQCYTP